MDAFAKCITSLPLIFGKCNSETGKKLPFFVSVLCLFLSVAALGAKMPERDAAKNREEFGQISKKRNMSIFGHREEFSLLS